MTTPEIPDSHKDLLGAQVAVLGTIGASGRPQLSATWFLADGDTVKISLNTARQKVKNLQADPKASLLILDPGNPYRYVELRGDAEITPDSDYVFARAAGGQVRRRGPARARPARGCPRRGDDQARPG